MSRNHYAILIRVATGIGDSDAGEQQTFDEEPQIESYLRSLFETPLSNAGVRIEDLKAFAYARSLTSEEQRLLTVPASALSDGEKIKRLTAAISRVTIAVNGARDQISRDLGFEIDFEQVRQAFLARLGLSHETELLDVELTPQIVLAALREYPFERTVETIRMSEPILPSSLRRHLVEEKIKAAGEIWYIRQGDPDDWPSSPHAHNPETGLKLDLRTGDLYDPRKPRVRAYVRTLRLKDLKALRHRCRSPLPPMAWRGGGS